MARMFFFLLASFLSLLPAPSEAARSKFCKVDTNQKFDLDFDIKPSMVVNDDTMAVTFSQAQQGGGEPGENLFSFRRTISTILKTAESPNDQPAQEAFLRTMISSFTQTTSANRDSGVLMPLDERSGEAGLSAADLLNETTLNGMKPLALFNRFDLAPKDWSHCGEHRIVYGMNRNNVPDVRGRLLLIFEAMVPNPQPSAGEAGCRPIAEFWASLSKEPNAVERAKKLAAFYYEGDMGPGGTLPRPVVNFENYGGAGGRGQVRGNIFINQVKWQLREWLTLPNFGPGSPLSFAVETVKDNPLIELYKDDLNSEPVMGLNVSAAVTTLHGNFIKAFSNTMSRNLMVEDKPEFRDLLTAQGEFSDPSISTDVVLINAIGLGAENQVNEHQSVSHPKVGTDPEPEVPAKYAGQKLKALLDRVMQTPSKMVNPQSTDVLLNRAGAMTCAGCHEASRTTTVLERPDGGAPLTWPNPQGRFVHVNEKDRALSEALETVFLPFRRFNLGRHLCKDFEHQIAQARALAVPTPPALNVLEQVVAEVAPPDVPQGLSARTLAADRTSAVSVARALPQERRESLQRLLIERLANARAKEQQTPGAFVPIRRSH